MYRHVVIPSSLLSSDLSLNNAVIASSFSRENKEIKSIDLIMYEVSEKKDIAISKVLRCLKEVAIDCQLFKKRNEKDSSFDYKRECEYENVYMFVMIMVIINEKQYRQLRNHVF